MERIYLVIYSHRHGDDYFARKTLEAAHHIGAHLARERRMEMEDEEEYEELDSITDDGEYISKFNEIEGMSLSGESIYIEDVPLVE